MKKRAPQPQTSKSIALRFGMLTVSFLITAVISWSLRNTARESLYIWIIPSIVGGAIFGIPGGLVAGLLASIASGAFYRLFITPIPEYTISIEIITALVIVLIGGISGFVRRLIKHKNRLEEVLQSTLQEKNRLLEPLLKAKLDFDSIDLENELQVDVEKAPPATFYHEVRDKERLVYVKGKGRLRIEEVTRAMRELVDSPNFNSRYQLLIDVTEILYTPIIAEIEYTAVAVAGIKGIVKEKIAILVKGDVIYALSKLFVIYAKKAGLNIQTFDDMNEAKDWLAATS
jgi:hypothetical protein